MRSQHLAKILACVAMVILNHNNVFVNYTDLAKARNHWKPAVEALCIAGLAQQAVGLKYYTD